ncbi:MAG: glycine--tRNA ligase subunit beta [Desulfobacterales bacterium]|nr:glycine--tRNA ligase subunit beta [Desulfobacterales bacterium]MDD4071075.1 glycine--tRNA ligase subunit beta [Desulfobacterales bacterium]MDD4392156.1 glycine--tRNA ligase subunit beta [Desulfobacterales bacterium]
MESLLLEIGTEEIPAGYIEPALDALASKLLQRLTQARIGCGQAKTFATPRRLAVIVEAVAEKQESLTSEVMGPPEKVAFDRDGNPTVAAEKFAEKVGLPLSDVRIKETPKGRYLYAVTTETGGVTTMILKDLLPEIIQSIPFPKTMKWAELALSFARPVHSVLALFGSQIIPFSLENIKSGKITTGHRFTHPGAIEVNAPEDYVNKLRAANVFADLAERRQMVVNGIEKTARELGGKILPDEELVDIVKNIVELPVPVAGKFDTKYLELPEEVLITAMREHQKYFAVVDDRKKLMPCFIAVNNTPARDLALVAKGHERVLRARLEDAQFFYRSDLKQSMDDWVEQLKRVLFQASLGSMYDKISRVQKNARFFADELGFETEVKSQVSRAAWLCKADLVSQVVVEFTKLQGIMGRVYAAAAGEPAEVAAAIEEHYRPTYSGGPLPETTVGALVALADKLDSICGCFSAGLVPTGASDPYALRRQGIGIVQIMCQKNYALPLREMITHSVRLFGENDPAKVSQTTDAVYTFLLNRMGYLLAEEGYSKDVIAAVLSVSGDHIPDVWRKVRALEALKSAPDFEPLAAAFKRVVNIIKKTGQVRASESISDVNEALFEDESEFLLYKSYQESARNVSADLEQGRFDQALLDIASLKNSVDTFFDKVLVMAEAQDVQNNRLALLAHIAALFETFADFSKITT